MSLSWSTAATIRRRSRAGEFSPRKRLGYPRPVLRAGGDLLFETLETVATVSAAEWDTVVDCADAPIFYRHAFLLAYERTPLEPTHAVRYVVARDPSTAAL